MTFRTPKTHQVLFANLRKQRQEGLRNIEENKGAEVFPVRATSCFEGGKLLRISSALSLLVLLILHSISLFLFTTSDSLPIYRPSWAPKKIKKIDHFSNKPWSLLTPSPRCSVHC